MVRIYAETVKKWAKVSGITGALIFLIIAYSARTGAIIIDDVRWSPKCAGQGDDVCWVEYDFHVNPLIRDGVFWYPVDYDPWGRNTPFDFSQELAEWKLQRSWGKGWRTLNMSRPCQYTWCGAPRNNADTKYSIAWRPGRNYTIRVLGYKKDMTQDIDVSFNPTVTWEGIKIDYELLDFKTDIVDAEMIFKIKLDKSFTINTADKFTTKLEHPTNFVNKGWNFLLYENESYMRSNPIYDLNCTTYKYFNGTNSTIDYEINYNPEFREFFCPVRENINSSTFICIRTACSQFVSSWKNYTAYRDKWIPFNPVGKTIQKDKWYVIKLVAKKEAVLGFSSVDVKPCLGGFCFPWAWWDTDWSKREAIGISFSDGYAVANYSVFMNVTYDSDMQTDFDDLRFVDNDNTTELGYCLGEDCIWDNTSTGASEYVASQYADIYVRVLDTTPATIWMFYNNDAVSTTSDIDLAYLNFDNFGTGDCNDWTVQNGAWSCASNYLEPTDNDVAGEPRNVITLDASTGYTDVRIISKNYYPSAQSLGLLWRYAGANNFYVGLWYPDVLLQYEYDSGWSSKGSTACDVSTTTWYTEEVLVNQSYHVSHLVGNAGECEHTFTDATNAAGNVGARARQINHRYDNYTVMKYHYIPPTVAFGDEETLIGDNPPTTTLTSPPDASGDNDGIITFNCSATDDYNLTRRDLWHNGTGVWHLNDTNTSLYGKYNFTEETVNFGSADQTIVWNCNFTDNSSQSDWGSSNFTVKIDTTIPQITKNAPTWEINPVSYDWAFFNSTISETPTTCYVEWCNSTCANNTMTISGAQCTLNITGLNEGLADNSTYRFWTYDGVWWNLTSWFTLMMPRPYLLWTNSSLGYQTDHKSIDNGILYDGGLSNNRVNSHWFFNGTPYHDYVMNLSDNGIPTAPTIIDDGRLIAISYWTLAVFWSGNRSQICKVALPQQSLAEAVPYSSIHETVYWNGYHPTAANRKVYSYYLNCTEAANYTAGADTRSTVGHDEHSDRIYVISENQLDARYGNLSQIWQATPTISATYYASPVVVEADSWNPDKVIIFPGQNQLYVYYTNGTQKCGTSSAYSTIRGAGSYYEGKFIINDLTQDDVTAVSTVDCSVSWDLNFDGITGEHLYKGNNLMNNGILVLSNHEGSSGTHNGYMYLVNATTGTLLYQSNAVSYTGEGMCDIGALSNGTYGVGWEGRLAAWKVGAGEDLDFPWHGGEDRTGYLANAICSFGTDGVCPAAEDVTPPTLDFVSPTLSNTTTTNNDWIYVNVSANESLNSCLLDWNLASNVSMTVIGQYCYKNQTGLSDGSYYFHVYGNDSSGNMNVTEDREITIDATKPKITIYSPTNSTYFDGCDIWINWTANETLKSLIVELNGIFDDQNNGTISLINTNQTHVEYSLVNNGSWTEWAGNDPYDMDTFLKWVQNSTYHYTPQSRSGSHVKWVDYNISNEFLNDWLDLDIRVSVEGASGPHFEYINLSLYNYTSESFIQVDSLGPDACPVNSVCVMSANSTLNSYFKDGTTSRINFTMDLEDGSGGTGSTDRIRLLWLNINTTDGINATFDNKECLISGTHSVRLWGTDLANNENYTETLYFTVADFNITHEYPSDTANFELNFSSGTHSYNYTHQTRTWWNATPDNQTASTAIHNVTVYDYSGYYTENISISVSFNQTIPSCMSFYISNTSSYLYDDNLALLASTSEQIIYSTTEVNVSRYFWEHVHMDNCTVPQSYTHDIIFTVSEA